MTLFNYISALEIDFHKETLVAKFHVLAARRNLFPSNVQWAGMPHTCLGKEKSNCSTYIRNSGNTA
jgi:hypothetical protein